MKTGINPCSLPASQPPATVAAEWVTGKCAPGVLRTLLPQRREVVIAEKNRFVSVGLIIASPSGSGTI